MYSYGDSQSKPVTGAAPMSLKPHVEKLDDLERRLKLNAFLNVVHAHPDLAHVRQFVRTPADRQLALIAALERAATRGTPLAFPPQPDDHADALLCDILDALDHDPDTSHHGAYYGPDRHLANLQALGLWNGNQPCQQPTALELFTTRYSDLTAEYSSNLRLAGAINSPLLQDSSPHGELIASPNAAENPSATAHDSPQFIDLLLVTNNQPALPPATNLDSQAAIIHHESNSPGELITEDSNRHMGGPVCSQTGATGGTPVTRPARTQFRLPNDESSTASAGLIPARPVRRGPPILLDERAKGRVLGLLAYGLSLRQAAAQLGLHHTTILAALKRDEEFAEQVAQARLDAIAQPLITVVQASRRSWRAAAWLAKFLDNRNNKPAPSEAPNQIRQPSCS
jgi:hypothetical protein